MPNTPIGQGPRAAPPTPPATPAAKPKRGWETQIPTRSAPLTPPATPPTSPPSQTAQPPSKKRYTAAPHAGTALSWQRPGATSVPGAPISIDAAGHRPLSRTALKTLSPAERNIHDHWFGRSDRKFHSHAKEFEMLAEPITSWQAYMALARSVVIQKNSPITEKIPLAFGKTGLYDRARNLFVVCAPEDGHIITMYRPGLHLLPDHLQPKVLGPLAQGQRYVANLY